MTADGYGKKTTDMVPVSRFFRKFGKLTLPSQLVSFFLMFSETSHVFSFLAFRILLQRFLIPAARRLHDGRRSGVGPRCLDSYLVTGRRSD